MLQVLGKIHKMSYNNFPSYKPLLKCDAYKLGLISSSEGQVACTFLPAATLGAVRSTGAKKCLCPSVFIICLIDFPVIVTLGKWDFQGNVTSRDIRLPRKCDFPGNVTSR